MANLEKWLDTLSIIGGTLYDTGNAAWGGPVGMAEANAAQIRKRKAAKQEQQAYQSLLLGLGPQSQEAALGAPGPEMDMDAPVWQRAAKEMQNQNTLPRSWQAPGSETLSMSDTLRKILPMLPPGAGIQAIMQMQQAQEAARAKARDPVAVGKNQRLVRPGTGEVVYSGEPDDTTSVVGANIVRNRDGSVVYQGPPDPNALTFQQRIELAKTRGQYSGGAMETWGQPIQTIDENGNPVLRQFSNRGQERPIENATRVSPSQAPGSAGAVRGAVEDAKIMSARRGEIPVVQRTMSQIGVKRGNVYKTIGDLLGETEDGREPVYPGIGPRTAGMGGQIMSNFPWTDAGAVTGALNMIKANLGFDELQAMREASKTGGALGQVAVQELEMLQSVIADLSQFRQPAQVQANLKQLRDVLRRQDAVRGQAFQETYGPLLQGPVMPSVGSGQPQGNNVSRETPQGSDEFIRDQRTGKIRKR